MPRSFTCHWKFDQWRCNEEGSPIDSAGHSSFRARGVQDNKGHRVYIVSISDRHLYLGGRMVVDRVVSREEAVRVTDNDNLWDAPEWVIGDPENGTPLNTYRRLAPEVARRLKFVRPRGGEVGLFFIDPEQTKLDGQTTRIVRELTPASAALLDQIIEITDRSSGRGELITVTNEMLRQFEAGR